MSGIASSSQSTSTYGSGAISHVYIQYPPLRCRVPESLGLYYDDGNKLLISPTSDQVFSFKTVPFTPQVSPTIDSISEGPILSIRYSLDAKILAIQRSTHEVQFWLRETGDTFTHKYISDSESILGFFWTDCPTCDVVFVRTSGLDMFSYESESKSLVLVETKRLYISWYVYTHESRLVLLASGMQCKSFTGYQLSSVGIVRLPRFEMSMTKTEVNSKPVLAAEDVRIVTVYGRIYCLQIDRVAMLLHSYRFYRDAVVQQGSVPIYSSKVAVSVIDNVLLIHQVDAKVVIIYDLFTDSKAPVSAPLPLLLRGFSRTAVSSTQSNSQNDDEKSEGNDLGDTESTVYGDDWIFLVPDLICDLRNGCLWKINLDLEAISDSSSEVPSVLEFLQRRKLEAKKAKQLCLTMTQMIILERKPVSMVSRAIEVLVTAYSYSVKTGTYSKGIKPEQPSSSAVPHPNNPESGDESVRSNVVNSDSEDSVRTESSQSQNLRPSNSASNVNILDLQESNVTSAAITTDELFNLVFAPVEEELGRDSSYLVAIIVELIRSANVEKVKVDPNLYVMTVRLLARNDRFAELGLFIINKIIEPSKEVAMQLLDAGRKNIQTRKLGMDMLRQLMLHHEYVVLLVQDGYYLEALRYARKNKVNTVQPSMFLEAAYAANDSQHVASVLRFFSDFIPGFTNTSDHDTYRRILAEMNSSIAV